MAGLRLDQANVSLDHGIKRIAAVELAPAGRQASSQGRLLEQPPYCCGKSGRVRGIDEQRTWLAIDREHLLQDRKPIGDHRKTGLRGLNDRKSKRLARRRKNEDVERAQERRDTLGRKLSREMHPVGAAELAR